MGVHGGTVLYRTMMRSLPIHDAGGWMGFAESRYREMSFQPTMPAPLLLQIKGMLFFFTSARSPVGSRAILTGGDGRVWENQSRSANVQPNHENNTEYNPHNAH